MVMVAFVGFPKDGHVFSASEVGLALAGFIAREPSGLPRVGMLGDGPTFRAVPASWKVELDEFVYAHQVAGALQLSGISSEAQVDITPAVGDIPAGQARIDVLCWSPTAAELTVVEGVPATSPQVPATGALAPVLRVRVNAGDSMVINGQITPVFAKSLLAAASAPLQQSGWADHPSGGATLVAGLHRSTQNYSVAFPTPFDAVPNLQATASAGGAQVAQWVQVFGLTRFGFSWRIISVGQVPMAGTMNWEAEPR